MTASTETGRQAGRLSLVVGRENWQAKQERGREGERERLERSSRDEKDVKAIAREDPCCCCCSSCRRSKAAREKRSRVACLFLLPHDYLELLLLRPLLRCRRALPLGCRRLDLLAPPVLLLSCLFDRLLGLVCAYMCELPFVRESVSVCLKERE